MKIASSSGANVSVDGIPAVSGRRLLSDLATFRTFGGRIDGGVDRVAGSPADIAGRAWLADRISQAGLAVSADAVGNAFGRIRGGREPRLLTGSHTDTVPAGGYLDGAYGVIAALEVLRTLSEAGHPAAQSLEIVGFFDEEGIAPYSAGGLTGSTAFCDSDHVQRITGFIELHIEQGPRMEAAGTGLAVVEGIVGIERHAVTMRGVPNHAGTTPMSQRADAGRAAAVLVARVRDVVLDVDGSMVVNVGCIEFLPGAPNVIPGEARLVVEWRAGSEAALRAAGQALNELASRSAAGENCSATVEQISRKPVTEFNPGLCKLAERACQMTGGPVGRLLSYAGHDASVLSRHVPTTMLFVPSSRGISHAPEEETPEHLLVLGCQALLRSVLEINGSEGAGRL